MNALPYLRMLLDTAAIGVIAKATVIVVLAAGATLGLPRLSAARRHLVWFAALVACAAVVLVSPVAPAVVVNIPIETAEPASTGAFDGMLEARLGGTASTVVGNVVVPANAHTDGEGSRRIPATSRHVGEGRTSSAVAARVGVQVPSRAKAVVIIAWIVGCLTVLSRAMLGQFTVARLVRHSVRDVSFDWAPSLASATDAVGLRHAVRILICQNLEAPVTSGVVRPVILLPANADEWPEERRRAVLVHELAHIARADYVTQLIGLFACALLWFHPLMWVALARLRAEAECAADDRVLASGMSAIEYASHLLDLARGASRRSLTPVVAVGVVSTSRLERRFRALLDGTRPRASVSPRLRTVAASLTLAVVFPVAGLRVGMTPRTLAPSATLARASSIAATRVESGSCKEPDSVAFRVEGNVDAAELRAVVGIVPGMTVTQWMLARAIRQLYATRTVDEHVSTACDTIAGKSVLVFNVRDRASPGARADTSVRARGSERSTASSVPLDEIVAAIGDQAITRFDVGQRVLAKIQRKEVPEPTTDLATKTLEQETLNGLIDDEHLLQRAKELGIGVPDSDVAPRVDAQIRETRGAFGSESEYEKALAAGGLGTPDEYRRFLFDQYRVRLTLEKTRSRLKRGEDAASGQTRGAANRSSLPPWVTFRQIVIVPHPSAGAKESARAEAESLLAEVRMGADFVAVSKRASMDARTKDVGGDLSWITRNLSLTEWDRWLFGTPLDPPLSPGQVIFKPVIETPFGFAVLRAEGVSPGRIHAQVILRSPKIDDADVASAKVLAENVAGALKAGAVWDTLANKYHDFTDKEATGVLTPVRLDSLPPAYRRALESHSRNDIVVFYDTGSSRRPNLPRYVVAQLLAIEDRH